MEIKKLAPIYILLFLAVILLGWNLFEPVGRYQVATVNKDYMEAVVIDTKKGEIWGLFAGPQIKSLDRNNIDFELRLLDEMSQAILMKRIESLNKNK